MDETSDFILRPRLGWRLAASLLTVAAAVSLVTADGRDFIAALVTLTLFIIWTLYLWSARVEVANGTVTLTRFGRTATPVRLDNLRHWDQTWQMHPLPTPELEVEDADGNNLTLEAVWWAGWSHLKSVVLATGAPKWDIKMEDLGPRPMRWAILAGLLIGAFLFATSLGYFLLTSDDPLSISLGAAGIIGGFFAIAIPIGMFFQLRRKRDKT